MPEATPHYLTDNVFVELGLGNLKEDRKLKLLDQMNEVVHKRTMLRILESLPDTSKEELSAMTDLSNPEQAKSLLQRVPNLAAIILEEVDQVKVQMKAAAVAAE